MIKNILLCGLGGVGCVLASSIVDSKSGTLKILVDENRYEKYLSTKKTFNKKEYDYEYIKPNNESFKADLIIIATKNDGLNEAIKNIKNFIKEKTIIISVLNGIHSEEKLAQTYGWDKLLISFYIGNSCIREGRNITLNGDYTFFIGEKDGSKTEKLEKLEKFFKASNINFKTSNKIMERYWRKFLVNIGLNQPCAVKNTNFKEVKQDINNKAWIISLIKEAKTIAEAEGITNTEEIYNNTIKFLFEEFEDAIPSMLQDIRAKRKTEVDIFAGEIIKLGEKHNIPVPENKKIYKEIKEIESKFI